MVDSPNHHFHLSAELLVLANTLNLDDDLMPPEMERDIWTPSPWERRRMPSALWDLSINGKSDAGDSDGDSDEADDGLGDFEDTAVYPGTGPLAHTELAYSHDGNPDNVTIPTRNGSPKNLPSYMDARDSAQDALVTMADKDPTTNESLPSEKTTVEKPDGTAPKPAMLELGAQSKISTKKYIPSPLSQTTMIDDADEIELLGPKTPVKSTLQQNIVSDGEMQLRQSGDRLSDLVATSQPENTDNGPVEQRQISIISRPKIAEIEEVNTSVDSIEGNAISCTVPFRDRIPPGAQSYGKIASKFVKGLIGKGINKGKPAEDQPLPPGNGEVPGEPKQSSDASTQTRKRRSSSSSSGASKRSRSSSNPVLVSGRRLPLLFTLATSSGGAEHRHVVIPLPISWPRFLRMAVRAFARDSCGQEIPTEVSDQAKYVMKWSKPTSHAHGDIFPKETELCGGNINAVFQWMLYSGSYDFCEIHDTQMAESNVKDEAHSLMSEKRPREQNDDGSVVATETTAESSKGNHETASNVTNSWREGDDQSQEDIEFIGDEAVAAAGRRNAELARKAEQNVRKDADAEGRESVGIQDNSMTETGVDAGRKGG